MNRSIFVVGLNIGKLYSGYTFSTIADFEKNPNHVKTWRFDYLRKPYDEIPTSILLNAERGFQSFGYEAEGQYMSLTDETKSSDVYFFQHFLCQTKWYRKNGKIFVKPTNRSDHVPLKALLIHSVCYLQNHFLKTTNRNYSIEEKDILWVVVYPDVNEFDVRFTFNETCLTAGISEDNFVLVKESIAIKSFTRHIAPFIMDESNTAILNCTLPQLSPNKALQIYPKVPTVLIGISSVISDIDSIMTERLGCSMFTDLTDINDMCELINEIEMKLKYRGLSMKQRDCFRIRLPISFVERMSKHITNLWQGGFRLRLTVLSIDSTVIHEVFKNALEPLMNHFKREISVLNRATFHKVILVGDFSRYKMTVVFQVVFQDSFPQYEFIVPLNSYMSATIGATIAGHELQYYQYSRIIYVPKMSIVETSYIENELLSTPSGLNHSFSENAASKTSMDTTDLTGKNSNLSFLPDPIRPSKIAIKLQDLYESEYTESLAAIVENGCDDAKSEDCLLQIISEVYDECRKRADAQINTITQMFHPTVGIDDIKKFLPSDVVKPLIEYRRKNASQYLPRLINSFVETLPSKISMSNDQLSVCTPFIEKSMECCWLMCVTEPPMFLKFEWNKSEQIDLDELEIEGGDGKYVVNMRWPTLYLYENGPLMNKGVVNAK